MTWASEGCNSATANTATHRSAVEIAMSVAFSLISDRVTDHHSRETCQGTCQIVNVGMS